jgi:hypothetical protein
VRSVHAIDYPAYGDHLIEAVRSTTGPVLCMGAHEKVLTIIDELCRGQDRLLVTLDGEEGTLARFERFLSQTHFVDYEADPSLSQWLERDDWGVIFIDHTPGNTRARTVERARDKAEYVIVHDTDELDFALDAPLSEFLHQTTFKNSRPWTTVASIINPVWEEEAPEVEKERFVHEMERAEREEAAKLGFVTEPGPTPPLTRDTYTFVASTEEVADER